MRVLVWGEVGDGVFGVEGVGKGRTLRRIVSSTGVVDMVESLRRKRGRVRGSIRYFSDVESRSLAV